MKQLQNVTIIRCTSVTLRHLYALHLLDFAVNGHEDDTGAHTGKGFKNEFDLLKGE